jgi:putative restriction endonuclease
MAPVANDRRSRLGIKAAVLRGCLQANKYSRPIEHNCLMDRFALGHAAWPILVARARTGKTMYYIELAEELGYTSARVSRAALWSIQDFCTEKSLPSLTGIVVNKKTGVPGAGFRLGHRTLGDAQQRAFAFDWSSVARPFPEESRSRLGRQRSLGDSAADTSFEVSDADAIVNGRGPYQDRFRKRLTKIYGGRCALCDTRHENLLVASHIVPWAEDAKNRLNPQNGILLCRTHDAALESGLIHISPEGLTHVAVTNAGKLGKDLYDHLRRTLPRLRSVPRRFAPSDAFLQWRFAHAKA